MTKKVYGRKETDPERLRLLEAVAKAARADALRRGVWLGYTGMTFAERAAVLRARGSWRAVLEALAALEALDEKEQP